MVRISSYWVRVSLVIGLTMLMPTTARADNSNVLLDGKNVTYRRQANNEYNPAIIGDAYQDRDYLKVTPQGAALVLCRNGATWQVPPDNQAYKIGDHCPASVSNNAPQRSWWQLVWDGLRGNLPNGVTNPRTDEEISQLPYIISPRNTMILTERPSITWNDVEDTVSYTVQLLGNDLLWVAQTDATTLRYPSAEASLTPGVDYYLSVTTDTDLSSTEENSIVIQVLPFPEQERLKTTLNNLSKENLSPQSQAIIKASVYNNFGLYAETITALESYVNNNEKSATAYQLLGEAYLNIGLLGQAKANYNQVLSLTDGDVSLTRAKSLEGLGLIFQSQGDETMAIKLYQEAEKIYQIVGDEEKQREIQQRMAELVNFLP
ncbi:MAG: tetratricopeptide repeat protein [Crocosphaera sp.]|nr:tetratricopeptide repeat protein [Crocosphaera sp.]